MFPKKEMAMILSTKYFSNVCCPIKKYILGIFAWTFQYMKSNTSQINAGK